MLDPAGWVGINSGTGLFDLPMGVDVVAIVLGLALVSGKKLV
jgi:hypothetical protein